MSNVFALDILEEKEKVEPAEAKIVDILLDLHITPNLSGYYYIKEALQYCLVYDRLFKCGMTTKGGLYDLVANIYETTKVRVERAIRHAVEVAFNRTDTDTIEKYFRSSTNIDKGKLTNSEFIGVILERLKLAGL